MLSRPSSHHALLVALAFTFASSVSRVARARSGGNLGGGCVGCHAEGNVSFSMSADTEELTPGAEVVFTLTMSASGANAAGVFIDAEGAGTFRALSGEGLAEVDAGLTHFAAKAMSQGDVSFSFGWTPPDSPGGVHFEVTGVAANGDGRPIDSVHDSIGIKRHIFIFSQLLQHLPPDFHNVRLVDRFLLQ